MLQEDLFILNDDLRGSLIKLRRLCYELSLLRLHHIDPEVTLSMEAFVEQQVSFCPDSAFNFFLPTTYLSSLSNKSSDEASHLCDAFGLGSKRRRLIKKKS